VTPPGARGRARIISESGVLGQSVREALGHWRGWRSVAWGESGQVRWPDSPQAQLIESQPVARPGWEHGQVPRPDTPAVHLSWGDLGPPGSCRRNRLRLAGGGRAVPGTVEGEALGRRGTGGAVVRAGGMPRREAVGGATAAVPGRGADLQGGPDLTHGRTGKKGMDKHRGDGASGALTGGTRGRRMPRSGPRGRVRAKWDACAQVRITPPRKLRASVGS
jgi:hypothetical protein